MAQLNDLDDVTISNPKVGDVVKYTATGWQNGADAGGEGVNGNPCGNLDHYTRDDEKETITEPWVWDLKRDIVDPLTEDVITVKDEQGNVGYFGPRRTRNANDQGFIKMQIKDDGQGLIQSQNTLSFVDSQVPDGVTLAALVAGGTGGGGGGGGTPGTTSANPVLAKKFTFDNSTRIISESFKQWKYAPNIDSDFRILNWKVSDPLTVTLPDWATGASIIYIQNHYWNFSDNITEFPAYGTGDYSFRQYSVHGLTLSPEALFMYQGGTGRNIMVSVLNTNITVMPNDATIIPGNRTGFAETTNMQIIKLTGSGKTFTVTQNIDLLKGGWNKFSCGTGKLLVFPMVYDEANVDTTPTPLSRNSSVIRSSEYQELLDLLYPPVTAEEYLQQESRDLKNDIIAALNVCNDALAETPGDSTIEGIRANIYALKTETSIDFATARFNVLKAELQAALDWKFPWEPAGYSLV